MIADKGTPNLDRICTIVIVLAVVLLLMGIAGLLPLKYTSKVTPMATATDETQSHFSRPSIAPSSPDADFSRVDIVASRVEESMRRFRNNQKWCAIVMTVFAVVLLLACTAEILRLWLLDRNIKSGSMQSH